MGSPKSGQNFLKARCARSGKIGMPKQLIQKTKLTFLNSSHRALSHIKSGFFLLDDFLRFEENFCVLRVAEPMVALSSVTSVAA